MKHRMIWMAMVIALGAGLAACAPDAWVKSRLGVERDITDFGPGFEPPQSAETGAPVHGFGGNGGGVRRTPLIIVHGTTGSTKYFGPMRDYFRELGYTDDEIWAVGYGWGSAAYWDTTPPSSITLDRFVNAVLAYLSKKEGRPIREVDMIGHSLGVMVVRHWVKEANAFDHLHSYVAVAGLNHLDPDVPLYQPDGRGPNRQVLSTLASGSPWLQGLNRGGDVPGPTRYMTLYDGTGWNDIFYPPPLQDAPRLEGAYNVPYNRIHGTTWDHVELMFKPIFWEMMAKWLLQGREPQADAEPPKMLQQGALVKSDQADAPLYCASGIDYPTAETAGVESLDLRDGLLHTCYARSQSSHLPSVVGRFKYRPGAAPPEPLTLTATPPGGVYEQSQAVHLSANDPDAYIVYSTVTDAVNSGSPLYAPDLGVYITSPLTLTARAYSPDGRVSEPLSVRYTVSLEMVDANRTLERQVDPSAPLKFVGNRRAGR